MRTLRDIVIELITIDCLGLIDIDCAELIEKVIEKFPVNSRDLVRYRFIFSDKKVVNLNIMKKSFSVIKSDFESEEIIHFSKNEITNEPHFTDNMELVFIKPELIIEKEVNIGSAVYVHGISSRSPYINFKSKYIDSYIEQAKVIQEKERMEEKFPEKKIKTKVNKI